MSVPTMAVRFDAAVIGLDGGLGGEGQDQRKT
jgi:hypothetical protein